MYGQRKVVDAVSFAAHPGEIIGVVGPNGAGLHARVATLSGGTRRRLNVAVALLPDPPVLIMDEPTAGMDVQTIAAFVGSCAARRQVARRFSIPPTATTS